MFNSINLISFPFSSLSKKLLPKHCWIFCRYIATLIAVLKLRKRLAALCIPSQTQLGHVLTRAFNGVAIFEWLRMDGCCFLGTRFRRLVAGN